MCPVITRTDILKVKYIQTHPVLDPAPSRRSGPNCELESREQDLDHGSAFPAFLSVLVEREAFVLLSNIYVALIAGVTLFQETGI